MRSIEDILSNIKPVSNEQAEANRKALRDRSSEFDKQAMITASGMPKRHLEAYSDIKTGSEWGKLNASIALMQFSGFLLALIGSRGTGKTQLAVAAGMRAIENRRHVKYASCIEFFMDVKTSYRQGSNQTEKDIITAYRKPSLLILDEVGKRGETEWENNLLFELVDKRYQDMTDTILISNLSDVDFAKSVGLSLVSRINECGGLKQCRWESFRK